jgi:hypothetical protein
MSCPVTEANLVDVTHLPVPVRWLLAVIVVLISGFFAGASAFFCSPSRC